MITLGLVLVGSHNVCEVYAQSFQQRAVACIASRYVRYVSKTYLLQQQMHKQKAN